MIEARGLTKRYGPTLAVHNLSFTIRPGLVTCFLGPNGAGKTTTMRMILGLDHPAGGAAQDRAGFDPTQSSILGLAAVGRLVIAVLGALAITSEDLTGMISTSLTVMPRRGVLYGARAAAFAAVILVIAVPATFLSFFIGQALLTSTHTGARRDA